MSSNHYSVDEEFEVTIAVKVKLKTITNYHQMSEEIIYECASNIKENMTQHLKDKITTEFYQEDLSCMCDGCNFEVR